MKILAIETSCDETAVAIVENGTTILTNTLTSSTQVHEKYGGVVPEVAARNQVEYMIPVLTEGMFGFTKDDIDAIAVTIGPGLIGSLLIGVETAKTLAFVWNKPLIPVNHVLAHMYANFVPNVVEGQNSSRAQGCTIRYVPQSRDHKQIVFPAISLVVSGGHTELYLMESTKNLKWLGGTLDDAAGECFDKTARLLGFGNRGGLAIQETACKFNVHSSSFTVKFPRPMLHDDSLNFSFSGLKTAVARDWNKYVSNPQLTTDNLQLVSAFAYEIQEAITDVLVQKTLKAAQKYNAKSILLSGGVASNLRLREQFNLSLVTYHLSSIKLFVPPVQLCTDNAVYIGAYAYFHRNSVDWRKVEAQPDLSVEIVDF